MAVLDTNFLISNLRYLQHLASEAERYPGSIGLVVPWIVIKELDGLKVEKRNMRQKGVYSWWMA